MAIEDDEFGAEPDVVENAAEVAPDWQDLFKRFRSAETGTTTSRDGFSHTKTFVVS